MNQQHVIQTKTNTASESSDIYPVDDFLWSQAEASYGLRTTKALRL